MSALTEKVAREHVRLVRPLGTCDGCSCTDEDVPSYADHVIEVTEAATRAQVAADIREAGKTREQVQAGLRGGMSVDYYDGWDGAIHDAALIAEEVGT